MFSVRLRGATHLAVLPYWGANGHLLGLAVFCLHDHIAGHCGSTCVSGSRLPAAYSGSARFISLLRG